MSARFTISIFSTALAIVHLALPTSARPAGLPQPQQANPQSEPSANSQEHGPSEAEIRERAHKLTNNQHKNDEALDQYERFERYIDLTGGDNPRTLEDKTYRVVPHGAGTMKIHVKDGDSFVSPAEYRRQLQLWQSVLETMTKPNNPRAKSIREKYEKRKRDRQRFVDAAGEAFQAKWMGSETRNGHACDVFELNPNPKFHSHSMFEDAMLHVMAKIWVDHESDQLVRGEVHVLSDISFGGGILGKLYKGGSVLMEQEEVAPGIWLPTRYQYDFTGRKFLFSFEQHQAIEVSRYRRIGSPQDALALVKSELASGKTAAGDP
jgi:hypothetical protein